MDWQKETKMAKGGGFEREVCYILSKWITNGKMDDALGRSDGSGSRFTARKKSGKDTANMAGDITFTHKAGMSLIKVWSLECKSGYGRKKKIKDKEGKLVKKIQDRWDILDCLDSRQEEPTFLAMWSQCKRDAGLSHRESVLIFRRNLHGICIAMQHEYFLRLTGFFGDYPSTALVLHLPQQERKNPYFLTAKDLKELPNRRFRTPLPTPQIEKEKIMIMFLKDFVKWLPNNFVNLVHGKNQP
jgi:hypothetical protein